MQYTKEQLTEILKKHQMWLNSEAEGVRADLSYADLSCADLSCANLRGANLRGADLYVNASENVKGVQLLVMHLTKHRLVYRGDTGEVQIGCKKHKLEYWLENYREIGEKSGYTESDIEAYGAALNVYVVIRNNTTSA